MNELNYLKEYTERRIESIKVHQSIYKDNDLIQSGLNSSLIELQSIKEFIMILISERCPNHDNGQETDDNNTSDTKA